ncbi:MAG: hypothetical protein M3Z04_07425, partial [Chloroflexota bacterium]|nr:hypothetical protein [Chloroflexota bacterium]
MDSALEESFTEALDDCLQRLPVEGLDGCLRRYPQYRAELEPLLGLALGLSGTMAAAVPRPAVRAALR